MPDFRSSAAPIASQQPANEDPMLEDFWTPNHLAWIRRSRHEQKPNQAALDHAMRVLGGEDVPARSGEQQYRFSASSIGGEHGVGFACWRKSLFKYAGWPQLPKTVQELDNMALGNACHLAAQVEGLSAGYIVSCETWDFDLPFHTGGKDDGLQSDGSLLELKYVKSTKFEEVLKGNRQFARMAGPQPDHLFQIRMLMILKDLRYSSLVYVNRENGEFKEFRIRLTDDDEVTIDRIMGDLNDYAERDVLPRMLPRCVDRVGYQYTHCEYRDRCPTAVSLWQ